MAIADMQKKVIVTIDSQLLENLRDKKSFTRKELFDVLSDNGFLVSDASFRYKLQKFINSGYIVNVGHNAYCVVKENNIRQYRHDYSEQAKNIAVIISEKYPNIKFSIFELVQLNEFINHLLAHNVIFVSVESNFGDFVFDALKKIYPGRILIYPTPDTFHQYWYSDMIVIRKLVTEAPSNKKCPWSVRLEKILVDIIADPIITNSISASEYPGIYTDAFQKYVLNECCLFRYAKRRGVKSEILRLIENETNIKLRTRNK